MKKTLKHIIFFVLLSFYSDTTVAQKFISRNVEVSFLSETPIENIEAHNNQASALLDVSNGKIVFQVPIRGFHFDIPLMEEHFNENYMETEQFPNAILQGQIENWPITSNQVKVLGFLTIHGIEDFRLFEGTLSTDGENWVITSKFKINAEDFDIKIPRLVRKQIAEDIIISVNATLNPRE